MPVTAIVGANWGDEGKGKIIDFLAGEAAFVVRFQGGRNAGHTIINSYGKFVVHLLPSGVFCPNVTNILGPGVALDIQAFLNELKELRERNVPEPSVCVSDRAQIVMPYHILFDKYEEERLEGEKFGSTQKGIAPFYADKYMKLGIQVADLFDEIRLRSRLEKSLAAKNVFGLDKFFKAFFIEGELGFGKPDKEVYLGALEALGLNPEDVWAVGDNLECDVEGPRKLGIYSIWNDVEGKGLPDSTTVKPDRIINNISELLK